MNRFATTSKLCLAFLLTLLLSSPSVFAQIPFEVRPLQIQMSGTVGQGEDFYGYIVNYTSSPMTIDMSLSGPDAAEFSVDPSITVPNGSMQDSSGFIMFELRYRPQSAGSHQATLRFTWMGYVREIAVSGGAKTAAPVFGGPTDWRTGLNTTRCEPVYIMNETMVPITITSITLKSSGNFTINNLPAMPAVLTQGYEFEVCYAPTAFEYSVDTLIADYTVGNETGRIYMGLYGYPEVIWSGQCLEVHGDSSFGPVDFDETIIREYKVINLSRATLDLTAQLTGDPHFTILTALPVKMQVNDTLSLNVKFYSGNDANRLNFTNWLQVFGTDSNGQSCASSVNMYGYAQYGERNIDPTTVSLQAGKDEKLKVESNTQEAYRIFQFINSTNDNVKVVNVAMKKGDDMSARVLFDPPATALPLTLAPQQTMLVRIDITNPEPGDYKDDLIITTEAGLLAFEIPVEGTRSAASVGRETATTARIAIRENPVRASTMIDVANVQSATIEVLDMTGRVVATHNGMNFRWEATSEASARYIVRAYGIDTIGHPYSISEQMNVIR